METDEEYRARQKKEEEEGKRGMWLWGFFIGTTYWTLFTLFAFVIEPLFGAGTEMAFSLVSFVFCASLWILWLIWMANEYNW